MKSLLALVFVFSCCNFVMAQEEKSVLVPVPTPAADTVTTDAPAPVVAAPAPVVAAPVCVAGSCKKVNYKHGRFIAPNAVPTEVLVSRCETCRDACCNPVAVKTSQGVEICAPACPCKETVRTSLDGKRKVYDYGKYEVVVTDRRDEIEVKYRRRLLSR